MTDLKPLMITALNKEQAEYLVRSRAEQRGLHVNQVDVSGAQGGMWRVVVTVDDSAADGEAARLGDDTQIFHLANRPPRA